MNISRRTFSGVLGAAGLTAMWPTAAPAQSDASDAWFRHGVASGDPLTDRVILWTRVTPPQAWNIIPVVVTVAEDPAMTRVVARRLTYAEAGRDYTVKFDLTGLEAGKTYYYRFQSFAQFSPVGRTRTLPTGAVDRLRFGVASCSNLPYGFFHAYRFLARRADLDFVLHLGDYIYEYGNGTYGDGTAIGRIPQPNKELVTLEDYRTRYAQYRRDPDLQEVHRQHPFIVVWDDHESANDSWKDGAQNHQPEEGDWNVRKEAAIRAWYEWLPVREPETNLDRIYRSFPLGDLADLFMLDTRLLARDRQVEATSPAIADPNRTLLGAEQERWLLGELTASKARGSRWRLLGQQVMMGQLIGPTGPFNPDQWDGYLASRNRLLGFLQQNAITNNVVLTGDLHSSWGNDITFNPFDPRLYNPATGQGSLAVEFVGPGITSPGIEDPQEAAGLTAQVRSTHPHVKYINLSRRGYVLVDIDRERAQGEWYYPSTITQPDAAEEFAAALQSRTGTNHLIPASQSAPKPVAPPPAP
jgi:alkaline phosphatase D